MRLRERGAFAEEATIVARRLKHKRAKEQSREHATRRRLVVVVVAAAAAVVLVECRNLATLIPTILF